MKISVIHPSRSRPKEANRTIVEWLSKSSIGDNLEYILSLDSSDCSDYGSYKGKVKFIRNNNRSAIDAINKGAEVATGDLFVVVSDDFSCPEYWGTLLIEALNGKSDYCAKTLDGLQPTLMTLPIMDRVYYNRFGYIYYPEYRHMFCDQEMTAVAHMLGKAIRLPIFFPHNHYTTGKFKPDAITTRNNATWQQGEKLFNERLKFNFGIENPVIQYSQIKWR